MTGLESAPWLELIAGIIVTWSAGMFFPVLIRFVVHRKPLSRKAANWLSGINSLILLVLFSIVGLIYDSAGERKMGNNGVVFLLFWVNRWFLTRESKVSIKKFDDSPKLTTKQKIQKLTRITVGLIGGLWLGLFWAGATYNMLKKDLENNLFKSGLQMFVASTGSLFLMMLILICSLYAFSYVYSKKWFVGIIRIFEWVVSLGLGFMGIYGTLNYISKYFQGEGLFLSDILDDFGIVIVCFFLVKHLYKIPMTARIFENFNFPWKNKSLLIFTKKEETPLLVVTGIIKACPECNAKNPIKAAYCSDCGFNFRNEEVQHLLLKNRAPVIFVVIILVSIFALPQFHVFNSFPNKVIRENGGVVTTFAGSPRATGSSSRIRKAASFNYPAGVAVDNSGNLYVSDLGNNLILKISPGGAATILAGSGTYGHSNGTGNAASFAFPHGVAVDSSGNVYVADSYNNLIRKITPGGMVTTLAGGGAGVGVFGTPNSGSGNGYGTAASFFSPEGVAVDASGNVYVADTFNRMIRKITPEGLVSTLVGFDSEGSANATGTALFSLPSGVAVDSLGNVYVADRDKSLILEITPEGIVSTLAGSGSVGAANATGTAAFFNRPCGVAVDSSGHVYVADQYNHLIRKITSGGVVATLAGSGSKGSDNGTGTAASFNLPEGIAVNSSGNVYVADGGNKLIRMIH